MHTSYLTVLTATLLLAACNTPKTDLGRENLNPLTASRYGDQLADRMANLIIQDDPVMKEAGMEEYVKKQINEGKNIAAAARKKEGEGMIGTILPMKETVLGYGLYVDDMLYLSSDFESDPGSSLHVYLTTTVDPRDAAFPDANALDLGLIKSLYGPSSYDVPPQEKPELYRTLVFYETKLQRLYGFAQLAKGQQQ